MSSENMEDILRLTDEELQEHLNHYGVNAGPIVSSTRRVYQRKLATLMGSSIPQSPYTEEVDLDENDTQIYYQDSNAKAPAPQTSKVFSSSPNTTRKRYKEGDTSSLSFDHDRHTPSPRPSLRTVSSSTSTRMHTTLTNQERSNLFGENRYSRQGYSFVTKETPSTTNAGTGNPFLRLLVKLFFIIILCAIAWFTYQYYYQENPYKQLELLTRQALNSLEQSKSEQQSRTPKGN